MNANAIKNTILAVLAAAGSFIAKQLGGWDAGMRVLVALMVADYLTGLVVAGIFHKSNNSESGALDSKAGFKGILKKCVILLLIWIAVMLDAALNTDYLRLMVILFYIGNEGISLLENIGLMGVPYPAFLKKALQALREKGDKGNETVQTDKLPGASGIPDEEDRESCGLLEED